MLVAERTFMLIERVALLQRPAFRERILLARITAQSLPQIRDVAVGSAFIDRYAEMLENEEEL